MHYDISLRGRSRNASRDFSEEENKQCRKPKEEKTFTEANRESDYAMVYDFSMKSHSWILLFGRSSAVFVQQFQDIKAVEDEGLWCVRIYEGRDIHK